MKGQNVLGRAWRIPRKLRVVYFLILISAPSSGISEILTLRYDGFTVWIDCNRRGAIQFHYTADTDSGSHKRHPKYYIDPGAPKRCQQTATSSYKRQKGEIRYDRGHLVPANHLDGSKESIKQTNFMTNILPQVANMNRGAWLQTEEIVECYRDIQLLEVWGGVIWGDDPDNDYFVESHGITTPDAFWKVVLKGDTGIAWVIPNSPEAKRNMLDSYLVSIEAIEGVSGRRFDIPTDQKAESRSTSWVIPKGCDKG